MKSWTYGMEGMDEIFENGGVSTCAWVARPITWRGLVMYLDMVVPPGGILARISPEDGGQLLPRNPSRELFE